LRPRKRRHQANPHAWSLTPVRAALAALLLMPGTTALAATGPALDAPAVKQIALAAAQFHPFSAYQPDPRLSVAAVRLVHARRGGYVWYMRVHSTVPTFPCRLVPPGAPAPSCPYGPGSQDARVEIADDSGAVLSFRAA